jgi:hypothetical protein
LSWWWGWWSISWDWLGNDLLGGGLDGLLDNLLIGGGLTIIILLGLLLLGEGSL